jgi:hypothetical protein
MLKIFKITAIIEGIFTIVFSYANEIYLSNDPFIKHWYGAWNIIIYFIHVCNNFKI